MNSENEVELTEYQVGMLIRAFPQTAVALTRSGFVEALTYFEEFLAHSKYDVSVDEELKKVFSVFIAGWGAQRANSARKGNRE